MSVPALRFKQDDGQDFPEWKDTTLDNCASFFRGGSLSKSDIDVNGKFSCVHYGELFTSYNVIITEVKSKTNIKNTINSEYGDILMPSSDVTPAGLAKASCILKAGVVLGGDINVIRVKNTIAPTFLSYLLNFEKNKIIRLVSGTSVKHIYIKDIKSIELSIPTEIAEQTKIANFLTAIDEKITLLTQKQELLTQYKKGVMQQIFSQELHFKDDAGQDFPEWESGALGDAFEYKNGKSFENEVSENGDYFLVTLNSIDITGKLKAEHKRVEKTDFLLRKNDLVMILSDVAHGNFLGLTDIIPSDKYVLNQRIGGLHPKVNLDVRFASLYINFNQKYFKLHGQGSSQLNLSKGDVLDFNLPQPHIKEQTKIAKFLTAIDDKITNTQTQLQALKQYKQGLLQQMFV